MILETVTSPQTNLLFYDGLWPLWGERVMTMSAILWRVELEWKKIFQMKNNNSEFVLMERDK